MNTINFVSTETKEVPIQIEPENSAIVKLPHESVSFLCEEWERSAITIEECRKGIEANCQESLELASSIEILEKQVHKIALIYEKICAKIKQSEKKSKWKYPLKKIQAFLLSGAALCIIPIGLQSVVSNALNWTGFGLCLGGAVCDKVGSYLANSWGNEASEKGEMLALSSKAALIANTRIYIRILKYCDKKRSDSLLQRETVTLLRTVSSRNLMDSPLLNLDRRRIEGHEKEEAIAHEDEGCQSLGSPVKSIGNQQETLPKLTKEWERSAIVIEEFVKDINEEMDKHHLTDEELDKGIDEAMLKHHQLTDLTIPIRILKSHVKKLKTIYKKFLPRIEMMESAVFFGYPQKKLQAFVLSGISYCTSPVGLTSLAVNNIYFADRSDDTLKWVGVALCIASTLLDKGSMFFSNSWGNQESELAVLHAFAAKSVIITQTNSLIHIVDHYNTQTPQNKRRLKQSVTSLLRDTSVSGMSLESPLLRTDSRFEIDIELTPVTVKMRSPTDNAHRPPQIQIREEKDNTRDNALICIEEEKDEDRQVIENKDPESASPDDNNSGSDENNTTSSDTNTSPCENPTTPPGPRALPLWPIIQR